VLQHFLSSSSLAATLLLSVANPDALHCASTHCFEKKEAFLQLFENIASFFFPPSCFVSFDCRLFFLSLCALHGMVFCHLALKVFVCVFPSRRVCLTCCNLQAEFAVCFFTEFESKCE
jgi:hypothetical protein